MDLPQADETSDAKARPPVSCYIRTLNESRLIGDVVTAAQQVAREVVVVDSGSTDGTQDIAAAAGARVISNPWPGNGHQKRVGEEACTHDWLLDLDADEIVDADLAKAIRVLFARGEPPESVYGLTLITDPPATPPWTNFCLAVRNKLYDRRKWRMPAHPAWDQLQLPKEHRPSGLDGAIIHRSFRDFADLTRKFNSVSTARAKYTKPRSALELKLRIIGAFPFYFFKHFVLRGLFRAGVYGFAVAGASAHARWLRDVKMYENLLISIQKNGSEHK
ncbi:MAG: glycosyltransferase family 2 protein [Pseudomonadota bacterium]